MPQFDTTYLASQVFWLISFWTIAFFFVHHFFWSQTSSRLSCQNLKLCDVKSRIQARENEIFHLEKLYQQTIEKTYAEEQVSLSRTIEQQHIQINEAHKLLLLKHRENTKDSFVDLTKMQNIRNSLQRWRRASLAILD